MTTVLLIDSPLAVRRALRARLSLEPDLVIVGEADDATQAINLARVLDPDVMLLDAETPYLDALSVVRAMADGDRSPAILVLSQHAAAMKSGLNGTSAIVVGKHEGLASLVSAIRSVPGRRCLDEEGAPGADHCSQ
jgi:DNA-binding NarL/FixJ family response regulator